MCFWKIKKHEKIINRTSSDLMDKIKFYKIYNPNVTGLCFFLMKLLLCNVCYIDFFTRKI